jgi:hypothetical protein
MRKAMIVLICLSVSVLIASSALADGVYYAKCNIKVLKDNSITWVNWQAAPHSIPVGTKLKVTRSGQEAVFIREDTGEKYDVDLGADGDVYLEKFVSRKPVNISKFPKDVQSSIRKGIAKVGMNKEQVFMAMGAPAKVSSGSTERMTLGEIMQSDLWLYARMRFGKKIGVEFNEKTGKVIRTEGIWGKN